MISNHSGDGWHWVNDMVLVASSWMLPFMFFIEYLISNALPSCLVISNAWGTSASFLQCLTIQLTMSSVACFASGVVWFLLWFYLLSFW